MHRQNFFDNLRACLMIAGVIFHSLFFLVPVSMARDWSVRNTLTSPFYFYIILFIHIIYMPLFYLVAGYFAKYIYSRRGTWGFTKHRLRRIALPFLIAYGILSLYNIALFVSYYKGGLKIDFENLYYIFGYFSTLWFLWYLLIFYALILVFQSLCNLFIKEHIHVTPHWLIILFVLLGFVALGSSPITAINPPLFIGFTLPSFPVYFCFFLFGWILFERNEVFEYLKKYAGFFILIALVLAYPLLVYFIQHKNLLLEHAAYSSLAHFARAATSWFFCLGALGGFYCWVNHYSKVLRYYADASYWFYLAEIPVIVLLQFYFYFFHIPPFLKFIYVFVLSMLILTICYALFVRRTFIGVLLNGERR